MVPLGRDQDHWAHHPHEHGGRDLGGDITPWVEAYRRDCVTIGREVRLLWSEGQERALALDVDGQFGLVVRREDGSETTVRTGEVSVRGLYGYTE